VLSYFRHYIALALLLFSSSIVAVERWQVTGITITGNKVTKERLILQELDFVPGDVINKDALERSRQSVMDLGLFEKVDAAVDDAGIVTIEIEEKSYVLLIPRISHDSEENRLEPGLKLTVDNIAGLNQRLQVTYKQSKTQEAIDGKQDELSIGFSYPKVGGSQYNLQTNIDSRQGPIQRINAGTVVSEYSKTSFGFTVLVTRWLVKIGPSKGWLSGFGINFDKRDYSYTSGTVGAFDDDKAISMLAQINFTDVRNLLYSLEGVEYGYNLQQGLEFLGSDYQFNRHLFYYRRYMQLHKKHHNLNFQARIGLSDGQSNNLDEGVYAIDGYGKLRGYRQEVEGDSYVLLNTEYLRPLFGRNHIRGLLFVDVGNAYAGNSDIDLTDLRWVAGSGIRWKIRKFVDFDLSLEVAYDFDNKDNKVYFKTGAAF